MNEKRPFFSVDAAVQAFAAARPPGIYKEDYLQELYKRFDNADDTPMAPALPDWCNGEQLSELCLKCQTIIFSCLQIRNRF